MQSETTESAAAPVRQFSIFADNKVGRLNDLLGMLDQRDIHIMAITSIDATDSAVLRIIVDYPETAQELFEELNLVFSRSDMLVVEIKTPDSLHQVTSALLMCEVNIHYVYPFLIRPHGEGALAMHVEDIDLATTVLNQRGIKVLNQSDIAR